MSKFKCFSLSEWLSFLENRHQREIQLGLARIKHVAGLLNLLKLTPPVITVAGTNGKGSTVAALEAIYLAGGYQTASFTSPHLIQFNERIRINGKAVTDDDLREAFCHIEQNRGDTPLTYFEMTTLAALWLFKRIKLDLIILEVGMGGRLDATNIIDPDLAIIATIALDHEQFLGNNIEDIGREKAGILRKNIPFIYADTNIPQSILEVAKDSGAKMVCLSRDYNYAKINGKLTITYENKTLASVNYPLIHEKAAASAILASYLLHQRLSINENDWHKAMQTVFLPGRQQFIKGNINFLFDVAHNPQSVALLAERLQSLNLNGTVHAIFSALHDKNLCGLIKPMQPYVKNWYPMLINHPRAAKESAIMDAFEIASASKPKCHKCPAEAFQAVLHQVKSGDLIVVYGSFFTVNALLPLWQQSTQERKGEI